MSAAKELVFRSRNWVGILLIPIGIVVLGLADLTGTPIVTSQISFGANVSHLVHILAGLFCLGLGMIMVLFAPWVVRLKGSLLILRYTYGVREYELSTIKPLRLKETVQKQKDGSMVALYTVEFVNPNGKRVRFGMYYDGGKAIFEALKPHGTFEHAGREFGY